MNPEKTINPPSGFAVLIVFLALLVIAALCFWAGEEPIGAMLAIIGFVFLLRDLLSLILTNQKCLPFSASTWVL
ncbi:hypothetical protein ACRQ5D_29495 [Mucilaginibacter sp. P25]|uniref:hypothetical protein n=1 Tax=Mucilaginibacter sp. P25 TaxID=3423945 RepID=UPI003D78EB76